MPNVSVCVCVCVCLCVQLDTVGASIQQLRSLWGAAASAPTSTGAAPTTAPAISIPLTAPSTTSEDLRRFILGPASPAPPAISHKDMISHFVDFLSTKGMLQKGGEGGTASDALVQQFNAYLSEAGMQHLAAAIHAGPAAAGAGGAGGALDTASILAQIAAAGTPGRTAAAAAADASLPLLPALRLSTAASQAAPGVTAKDLLSGTALNEIAPSWWVASLEAAAQGGNTAIQPDTPTAKTAAAPAVAADAAAQPAAADTATTANGEAASTAAAAAAKDSTADAAAPAVAPTASAGASANATPEGSGGGAAPAAAAAAAAPFDPLLLPGPARTMQAIMAHVRARHAEFLKRCPEGEVLLAEALAASAELQAAQDKSLVRMAVTRTSRASRPPTPRSRLSPATSAVATTGAGTPGGDGSSRKPPAPQSPAQPQGTPPAGSGGSQQFAFPDMHSTPSTGMLRGPAEGVEPVTPPHAGAQAAATSEITPQQGTPEVRVEMVTPGQLLADQLDATQQEMTTDDYAAGACVLPCQEEHQPV